MFNRAKHGGHQLHGFNYLVKCGITNDPYTVIGYKGKQVRDNLDARDISKLETIIEESNLQLHQPENHVSLIWAEEERILCQ